MERTITIKQEVNIDLLSIYDTVLSCINDFFKDRYNVDDPETEIVDYESVIIDVLEFILKNFR